MLERMLSKTGKKIYLTLFILGVAVLGLLIYSESPLVDWINDLRQAIFSSERRGFGRTLLIGAIPIALIAFVPAIGYDMLTRQGKFER